MRDCFVRQLSPLKAYLFSSYADGTARPDSDFDFYIVVSDEQTDTLELAARAYKAARGVKKRPVDILVGTESKFEQRRHMPTVENEVYRKGVLLYEQGRSVEIRPMMRMEEK